MGIGMVTIAVAILGTAVLIAMVLVAWNMNQKD